jgi:hypothetical protein
MDNGLAIGSNRRGWRHVQKMHYWMCVTVLLKQSSLALRCKFVAHSRARSLLIEAEQTKAGQGSTHQGLPEGPGS